MLEINTNQDSFTLAVKIIDLGLKVVGLIAALIGAYNGASALYSKLSEKRTQKKRANRIRILPPKSNAEEGVKPDNFARISDGFNFVAFFFISSFMFFLPAALLIFANTTWQQITYAALLGLVTASARFSLSVVFGVQKQGLWFYILLGTLSATLFYVTTILPRFIPWLR
jgi:hypothetical protein